ncbi:MAG: molybdenum ABC transporter ATP-binding protein [Oleibacter sp.]|nr:molybdenum ABC transporter ATP-binding protein [Thalassolituus sp.]
MTEMITKDINTGDMNTNSIQMTLARRDFELKLNVTLPTTGIVAISGPSGSGKTSVLRCLAGLETEASADICFNGKVWQQGSRCLVKAAQRPLGYVFQEGGLLPHLTVLGNLQFANKRALKRGLTPHPDPSAWLEHINIAHLAERYSHDLSGGERQRVAIARALLNQPPILLLDEPLASLDYEKRHEVMSLLETLRREFKGLIFYVSHEATELGRLADHVIAIEQGEQKFSGLISQLIASGQPLGRDYMSVIEGQVTGRDGRWQLTRVQAGKTLMWVPGLSVPLGQSLRLLIDARDVTLTLTEPEHCSTQNVMSARIETIRELGQGQVLVVMQLPDCGEQSLLSVITAESVHRLGLQPQKPVYAMVKAIAISRR